VLVWDVDRRAPAYEPLRTLGGVLLAVPSPNGDRLTTTGQQPNGRLRVWDAATGRPVSDEVRGTIYHTTADGAFGLAMVAAPEGAADPARRGLQVWDLAAGRPVAPPDTDRSGRSGLSQYNFWLGEPVGLNGRRTVANLQFTIPGSEFVRIGASRLYDAVTWRPVSDDPVSDRTAGFSPDGRLLVGLSRNNLVVRSAETGKPVGTSVPLRGGFRAARWSSDGRVLVATDDRCHAHVWYAATDEVVVRDARLGDAEPAAAFGPDGRLVAIWAGNQARVWDAATGTPVTPVLVHPAPVQAAAFGPDGFRLLTACADGSVRVWPMNAGEPPARRLDCGPGTVVRFAVPVDPAADRVVTATGRTLGGEYGVFRRAMTPSETTLWADRPVRLDRVWDPRFQKEALVSPDGSRIAVPSVALEGSCLLLDARTGRPVASPLACGPTITNDMQVFFSPDGRTLATVCNLGEKKPDARIRRIRLWDAAGGAPLADPIEARGYGGELFACGGEELLVTTPDGTRRYDARSGRPLPATFPPGARVFHDGDRDRAMIQTPDGLIRPLDRVTGAPVGTGLRAGGTAGRGVRNDRAGTLWTLERTGGRYITQARDPRTNAPLGPPSEVPLGELAWPGGRQQGESLSTGDRVHLLDRATGRPTGVSLRQKSSILSDGPHFSGDGGRVVTAVEGDRVAGAAHVDALDMSSNSTTFSTAELWVWDAATGEPLAPPVPHLPHPS
jgi:WD40 repeat protein